MRPEKLDELLSDHADGVKLILQPGLAGKLLDYIKELEAERTPDPEWTLTPEQRTFLEDAETVFYRALQESHGYKAVFGDMTIDEALDRRGE